MRKLLFFKSKYKPPPCSLAVLLIIKQECKKILAPWEEIATPLLPLLFIKLELIT